MNQQGRFRGVFGAVLQLDTSEILKSLFDGLPTGFAVIAPNGAVLVINAAYAEIAGAPLSPEYNLFADSRAERCGLAALARKALEGRQARAPILWLETDGCKRAVQADAVAVPSDAEESKCVVLALRDLSRETAQVETLGLTRFLLERVQAAGGLAYWTSPFDRKLPAMWSPEAFMMFGLERGKFTPTEEAFSALIHPEDRAAFSKGRAAVATEGGGSFACDFRVRLPDESWKQVRERVEVYVGQGGGAPRLVGVFQDLECTAKIPVSRAILLVEDESELRELVAEQLRSAGFVVHEARGGKEALVKAAGRERFGMVITDVIMPSMTGPEFERELRRMTGYARVPVLYLSGYSNDELARHGLDPNTAEFLEKPHTAAQLLKKVKSILGEPAQ